MGDAGTNPARAGAAAACFTDVEKFGFSSRRLTLSTVGPSPSAFLALARAPGTLAWSVHAVDPALRKKLVPSAAFSPDELLAGLTEALQYASDHAPGYRHRPVMLAVTLLAGVNDGDDHAKALADFVRPLRDVTDRVVVDLIPYNPTPGDEFRRPTFDAVSNFQQTLRKHSPNLFVGVRNARGDDEAAACGQLATASKKRQTAGGAHS